MTLRDVFTNISRKYKRIQIYRAFNKVTKRHKFTKFKLKLIDFVYKSISLNKQFTSFQHIFLKTFQVDISN